MEDILSSNVIYMPNIYQLNAISLYNRCSEECKGQNYEKCNREGSTSKISLKLYNSDITGDDAITQELQLDDMCNPRLPTPLQPNPYSLRLLGQCRQVGHRVSLIPSTMLN